MRTLRVEVTAEDIAKGERAKCDKCPVALALQRATGASDVYVGVRLMYARGNGFADVTSSISRDVENWIDRFDSALAVEPFAFDLELP